jgi:hypothetical protein
MKLLHREKIKQIGQMPFSYYSSFDNEAYKGKIKSAGSVAITYYSAIEDKGFAGKIKSIGGNNFVYYSSQEAQVGLRGMLQNRPPGSDHQWRYFLGKIQLSILKHSQ